ncbi:MAG: hypothetical protein GY738_09895, partial [Pseudoalteromonas sp.]|nr:hypothetical protein [Pseudoalteromonas sp.]
MLKGHRCCITASPPPCLRRRRNHPFYHPFLASAFDHLPMLKAMLVELEIMPKVLVNGQKILLIRLPQLRLRFVDSFNFMHLGLGRLGAAFDLVFKKTWYVPTLYVWAFENVCVHFMFPMACLEASKCDLIRDKWPSMESYGYSKMRPVEKKEFLQFYEEEKEKHGDVFDTRDR